MRQLVALLLVLFLISLVFPTVGPRLATLVTKSLDLIIQILDRVSLPPTNPTALQSPNTTPTLGASPQKEALFF